MLEPSDSCESKARLAVEPRGYIEILSTGRNQLCGDESSVMKLEQRAGIVDETKPRR